VAPGDLVVLMTPVRSCWSMLASVSIPHSRHDRQVGTCARRVGCVEHGPRGIGASATLEMATGRLPHPRGAYRHSR
jgi:hypothetical protein